MSEDNSSVEMSEFDRVDSAKVAGMRFLLSCPW